jgi:hypothetical protein
VRGGPSVEEPFAGAGRVGGDAGVVEGGVEGAGVPRRCAAGKS